MKMIPATPTLPNTGCYNPDVLLASFKFKARNCTLLDLVELATKPEYLHLSYEDWQRVGAIQQSFWEAVDNNHNYADFTRTAVWEAYRLTGRVVARAYYEYAITGEPKRPAHKLPPSQLALPLYLGV